MKISNFWKTSFLSITFPFIDDFALNIREINDFFEVLAFDGLFWPLLAFLAFLALDKFLKQRTTFGDKN